MNHFPRFSLVLICLCSLNLSPSIWAQPGSRYQPIILDSTYHHTQWGVEPQDLMYYFGAFTLSFDGPDDDNGDSQSDLWGIPEWVAYEVKAHDGSPLPSYSRPKWMTVDSLKAKKIIPDDNTYAVSGTRNLKEVSGDYRYVRGHMCPKTTADRMSAWAGYNTHTVLNAVPQLQWQNNGIWKSLESQINDWADEYGQVWVVCGPVFFGKSPSVQLGQADEVAAAVPDAIFKIVIRRDGTNIKTLSFILPNIIPKTKKKFYQYLTSMERIEELTELSFLTVLDPTIQIIEKARNLNLSTGQKRRAVNRW